MTLTSFSAETIAPYFPKVHLDVPADRDGTGAQTVATWAEWRYAPDRYSTSAISVFLQFDPALQLGTYRSLYGCKPQTNSDGEVVFTEAELRDLCMALWPEARSKYFVRRCRAGWHRQRLLAAADK